MASSPESTSRLSPSPDPPVSHHTLPVRNSDLLLAILFGALIVFAHEDKPSPSYVSPASLAQKALLLGLAILQLAEGRVAFLKTPRGRMTSVFLQLALSFELMHITGDVASPYNLILLFPVVSTAALLGVVATVVASIAAVSALLAPLLLVDWGTGPGQYEMDSEGWHVLDDSLPHDCRDRSFGERSWRRNSFGIRP